VRVSLISNTGTFCCFWCVSMESRCIWKVTFLGVLFCFGCSFFGSASEGFWPFHLVSYVRDVSPPRVFFSTYIIRYNFAVSEADTPTIMQEPAKFFVVGASWVCRGYPLPFTLYYRTPGRLRPAGRPLGGQELKLNQTPRSWQFGPNFGRSEPSD
jgi:hypothetical protein